MNHGNAGQLPSTPTSSTADKGLTSGRNHIQGGSDTRTDQPRYATTDSDYEQKYAPDAYGEELSSGARVWSVYNDEATTADAAMVGGLNGTLDVLLVFAGLFSAVVTTFVAQSSQALAPDYAQITASLVYELTLLQRAIATGKSIDEIPASAVSVNSRTHNTTDIWVNALWLTSLTLSLMTALMSVLAKQWIHHFNSIIGGTPRDRAYTRQYRLMGFERWRVRDIIGFLPAILSLALLFFLAGLAVYVSPLSTAILGIIIGLSVATFLAYTFTIVLPILIPHCAYKSPISDYIIVLAHVVVGYVAAYLIQLVCLPYRLLQWIIHHRERRKLDILGPFRSIRNYIAPECPSRLSALERSDVASQHGLLTTEALRWLCSSSVNKSAASISMQAISAFPTPVSNASVYWSIHWMTATHLRDLMRMTSSVKRATSANIVERLARALLHAPTSDWLILKYHIWELELWEELFAQRNQISCPHSRAFLCLALLVRLCFAALPATNGPVLQHALHAVDWLKANWENLQLHPLVWCELDRAVRLCLLRLGDRPRWSEFSRHPDWRLSIGYKYVVSEEGGRTYTPPEWKYNSLEHTAVAFDRYATACRWNDGRLRFAGCMEELERVLSNHLAQLGERTVLNPRHPKAEDREGRWSLRRHKATQADGTEAANIENNLGVCGAIATPSSRAGSSSGHERGRAAVGRPLAARGRRRSLVIGGNEDFESDAIRLVDSGLKTSPQHGGCGSERRVGVLTGEVDDLAPREVAQTADVARAPQVEAPASGTWAKQTLSNDPEADETITLAIR